MQSPSSFHDVVIVGAGPVGLWLACELRLGGASVLVLEQAATPDSPLKRLPFGLRGLNAPSLEAFHRRGLLERLAATRPQPDASGRTPGTPHWLQQARRAGGHFAGIPFFVDHLDPTRWPYRLPGPAGTQMASDMASIEAVLTAQALALGVEIRRGIRVEALAQSGTYVSVDAGATRFRSRWLVGCDGARSLVRKAGGFAFVGTEPEFTGYSIDADLADPAALQPGRHFTATGMYTFSAPGTLTMADFDGGARHRQPVTLGHAQALLRRLSGSDVTLGALHHATTWTDRAFQATCYRNGRLLLAGDAAHTHSPLGGQGLNLGLGDAMNLGWKLAAVIRGELPDTMLDSYTAERHPIGAQVLDWSRAQVALMRPTPGSRALATVMRELMQTADGAHYVADRVWGTSLQLSPAGVHPLVGRSMPDFTLADGRHAGEHLRTGKGLLLDVGGRCGLHTLAESWQHRVHYSDHTARDPLGLAALLVRPDGVVAWVGDDGHATGNEADPAGLHATLAHWFGPPRP